MKTIQYYLSIIWWHIVAAYHAINADLAHERLDWHDYERCKGLCDVANKKWQDIRRSRLNRENEAYYQSIRDKRS